MESRQSTTVFQLLMLYLMTTGPSLVPCQQVTCVKQINNCKCQTNSGKFIDLSPLASVGDYRFKKVTGPNQNWQYSYNPCNGVRCDTDSNAASCQTDIKGTVSFQIGLQDTAQFGYTSSEGLHIKYTNGQSTGTMRNSMVSLVCRPDGPDEFMPTDDGGYVNPYVFHSRLTSKHACEVDGGGGGGGDGGGGGMSGGDILIIIVLVLLVVYLAGGFAVNVFLLKKAASLEALPNVTFWVALPGYVKDGAVFSAGKVRQLANRNKGYDNIG